MKKYISILLVLFVLVSTFACAADNEDIDGIISNDWAADAIDKIDPPFPEAVGEFNAPETEAVVEDKTFNIKLSFAGDMLLASFKDETTYGSFNEYAQNNPPTYFLEKVKHIFEDDDFSIVNLENVFTDRELEIVEKDHDPAYWYKSKTSNVEILTSSGIEGVSLANNHTNDYGEIGYNDTLQTVKDAGLHYGDANEIMYLEKNGFKIAIVCTGLWSKAQTTYVNNRLNIAKENSDYQIIFFHGGTERIHQPEEWKINACHELADNGADIIIGGHPHVLQPMEKYNGADIIYSIGNFCFGDGYRPENRTIIYQMDLIIDKETLAVSNEISKIIPCYLYTGDRNNYQPAVIENEAEKNKVLDFMNMKCDSPV